MLPSSDDSMLRHSPRLVYQPGDECNLLHFADTRSSLEHVPQQALSLSLPPSVNVIVCIHQLTQAGKPPVGLARPHSAQSICIFALLRVQIKLCLQGTHAPPQIAKSSESRVGITSQCPNRGCMQRAGWVWYAVPGVSSPHVHLQQQNTPRSEHAHQHCALQ